MPTTIAAPAARARASNGPPSNRGRITRSTIHRTPSDDATVHTAKTAAPPTAIENCRGEIRTSRPVRRTASRTVVAVTRRIYQSWA